MITFDSKQYYFENLIHMAFIAKYQGGDFRIEVNQINQKIHQLLESNHKEEHSLYKYYEADNSLENIIKLIIVDEDVVQEYIRATRLLLNKKYEEAIKIRWKYFNINKVVNSVKEKTYAIKSNRPDGILTNFSAFGDFKNDGGIYIDIYTVPQIDHNKIVGLQSLFPIVNQRRNFYIKNKKESELNIFHSLLVDMKNQAPSLLDNILKHDKNLSQKAAKTVIIARDYINGIINQSKDVLRLFSQYAYSDYIFEQIKISELKKVIIKKKVDFENEMSISYKIEEKLLKRKTLLIPEIFDYFLDQLIKNAVKEYEKKEIPIEKREVFIDLSIVHIERRPTLKISVLSKNTSIDSEILLDQAGKRPVYSSTSTGLGFYFLNTLLELLKASLPENHKERYFDLTSKKKVGVFFDFYYLIS